MMKKQNVIIVVALFAFMLMWPINVQAQSKNVKMSSAGCKTEYYLLKDLADAYKAKTGVSIQAGKTGNKKAMDLMLNDKVDFAFTCKPINKLAKKLKLDKKSIAGWKSIPIAKDPVVLVSHPKNGIQDLTTAQITDIFMGKVKNWKEVGGNNLPILLAYLNPALESGTTTVFKELTGGMKMKFAEKAKTLDGPSNLGYYVSSNPGAITFMAFNSYKKDYGNVLKIDGTEPSEKTIQNDTYKLSVTYHLTTAGNNKDVSNFVDYSLSNEGRKVISKNFYPYTK
jgi:ABC-type phosphate transport system substrate-binding protein